VAGCCSDDQQSESGSNWPVFISNFLAIWVRKSSAEVSAAKSPLTTEREQQERLLAWPVRGWTSGTGSTHHNNCGAFEVTSSGSLQKRSRDADLAFARLHIEVNIHSKVMLICRPIISDTNAEGHLYPLI
jgi:hypothetical protein